MPQSLFSRIASLLVIHGLLTYPCQICVTAAPRVSSSPCPFSQCGTQDPTLRDCERVFSFQDVPETGGVNITVTGPAPLLNNMSFVQLDSSNREVRGFCIPLLVGAATDGDGALVARSAVEQRLPIGDYCARLTTSCEKRRLRCMRPTRCLRYPHRFGMDQEGWSRNLSVPQRQEEDTDAGPTLYVEFHQPEELSFPALFVRHNGCVNVTWTEYQKVSADEWYPLHDDCRLAYDRPIEMRIVPAIAVCTGSHNCWVSQKHLRALRRAPPPVPAPVHSTSTSQLVLVGVPLLCVLMPAVAVGAVLWVRRAHRHSLDKLPNTAVTPENRGIAEGSTDTALLAAGPQPGLSVLLLHLARSDAERAAVGRLADELRARGAGVTDSGSSEWRQAVRRDAAALVAALPAGGRVLLLSSTAAAAAVEAAGPGEQERMFAAAVRQLAGSRFTTDYGRLYQARLTADAPVLSSLVPGAVYTLPEHQPELVAALLADTSTTAHTGVNGDAHTTIAIDTDTTAGTNTAPGTSTSPAGDSGVETGSESI